MKSEQVKAEMQLHSQQLEAEKRSLSNEKRWQKVVNIYERMGISLVSDWNNESSQKLVMEYAEMGIYLDPSNYDDQNNRSQI